MERIEIKKLFDGADAYADQSVTVCGWVRTLRDSKAIGFIEINDGSCFKGVQIVFEAAKLANYKDIAKLNVGSAIKVTGKLILTPNANQPFEINADEISVEGFSTPDYPLQKKRHSLEYLRTIADRGRIPSTQFSEFAPRPPMRYTNSSLTAALSTLTLP